MDFDGFQSLLKIMEQVGLVSQKQLMDLLEPHRLATGSKNINPSLLVENNIVSAWQLEKLLKGESKALQFQEYLLHSPVALGDLARTYKAWHAPTQDWVALKVLRKQFQKSSSSIEKFHREIQFLDLIHSDHLVKPVQTSPGTRNEPPFLAYPWLKLGSIQDQLQFRDSYPALEAIYLLNSISQVLLDLQKQGISHGNISARKFLLNSTRTVQIINFRHGFQINGGEEQSGAYEPSPPYLVFNQATGALSGDFQTDVFFTGCLFYSILTGRNLLPANPKLRIKKLQCGEIPLPFDTNLEKAIPREIPPIIRNMVNLDAKARYKDFSQVLPAIQAVRKKLETNAYPIEEGKKTPTAFLVLADENKRQLLRSYLQNRGLRVLGAISVPRALDAYRREPFRHLVMEIEDFESIRTGYLELVREAESNRMFLNILFLPRRQIPLQIPARHGNHVINPPQDLATIFDTIKKHDAN